MTSQIVSKVSIITNRKAGQNAIQLLQLQVAQAKVSNNLMVKLKEIMYDTHSSPALCIF